jgi:large subunit ribosomal protein L28
MPGKKRVTTRKPQFGQSRSKSFNTSKRQFKLNLQTKRYYVPELQQWIKVRLTTSDMKTVDKIGIVAYLKAHGYNPKHFLQP